MRPEDIDKLFKERLGNTSPTPPADLWNRLQERLEAEMPQQAPLQLKEEKRSYMWLYSSVAATVSLVLTVGVVFFNINTGTPEVNESLAEKGHVELLETPVLPQPAPATIAQAEMATENSSEEINLSSGATEATPPASTTSEEVVKTEAIAGTTPKAIKQKPALATTAKQHRAKVQQAFANNTLTQRAAEAEAPLAVPAVKPATPAASSVAKADANLNAAPVEIIIKRSTSTQAPAALAQADEAPTGIDKKAKLAKNIFKQVRNLASGDEVELSDLGIHADKVALNTQIGKQKFSKVINL